MAEPGLHQQVPGWAVAVLVKFRAQSLGNDRVEVVRQEGDISKEAKCCHRHPKILVRTFAGHMLVDTSWKTIIMSHYKDQKGVWRDKALGGLRLKTIVRYVRSKAQGLGRTL